MRLPAITAPRTAAPTVPTRPSWWQEASGAVADLGVLIPIAIALIVNNGLSATAVLLPAGVLYLVVAGVYRVPVAVQPLKAFAAVAIAIGASPDVIAAGALVMGVLFWLLGASGLLDRLGRVFPNAVIRGVQLAVGLTFVRIAWSLVAEPPASFTHQLSVGASAAAFVLVAAALLMWRGSSALVAVMVGLIAAGVATWHAGGAGPALGPTAMPFPNISMQDLLLAAAVLVLPQVPLTLTNSCLAPADAAPRYFPQHAQRITPGRLARTLGGANLAVSALAGMPVCHGAGGMSAHHAFGARSWRAPLIIGVGLTGVALALGRDLALILSAFPLPILAALLLVAGVAHVRLLADVRGAGNWSLALVVGVLGALGYLLVAVLGGVALARLGETLARRRTPPRRPVRPGEPSSAVSQRTLRGSATLTHGDR